MTGAIPFAIQRSLRERLAKYSSSPDERGCVLWTGCKAREGYGRLCWQGSIKRAHRLAWQEVNGSIPSGMFVCHRCDVPACINPEHLFLGTAQDNTDDKVAKGRQERGAKMAASRIGKKHSTEAKDKIAAYWAARRAAGEFKTPHPYAHHAKATAWIC